MNNASVTFLFGNMTSQKWWFAIFYLNKMWVFFFLLTSDQLWANRLVKRVKWGTESAMSHDILVEMNNNFFLVVVVRSIHLESNKSIIFFFSPFWMIVTHCFIFGGVQLDWEQWIEERREKKKKKNKCQ